MTAFSCRDRLERPTNFYLLLMETSLGMFFGSSGGGPARGAQHLVKVLEKNGLRPSRQWYAARQHTKAQSGKPSPTPAAPAAKGSAPAPAASGGKRGGGGDGILSLLRRATGSFSTRLSSLSLLSWGGPSRGYIAMAHLSRARLLDLLYGRKPEYV